MLKLLPTPKKVTENKGSFNLKGVSLAINTNTDFRVNKIAARLCEEIALVTKCAVPLTCGNKNKSINVQWGEGGEDYVLTVTESTVTVEASGAAGAYYAIQSLRQLVKTYGENIPCAVIEDAPDFAVRGFYQDITRGRVNTLDQLKHIVDLLASYKINSLQLYIEDAFLFKEFEGVFTADEAMTKEETIALDDYCYENFIELVPSLSTFGHLYALLQSERYKHLCELENYTPGTHYWMEKQWHHTIDAYNPESIEVIGSMIEQYIPLFRTDKFNICCDETMDLCRGRNKGKDNAEAYFLHVNKLIDLLKSHGKKVMMWGDVVMGHGEEAKKYLPKDVVVLNWNYNKNTPEWLGKFFWERGYDSIACPGTSSWNNFVEDVDISESNITCFAKHAKTYNALGILNTNWGDFGHVCAFNCNLWGMLLGAQKSWNVEAETGKEYETLSSELLYNVTSFNMTDTLRALGKAQRTANWFWLVMWYSANLLEGRNTHLGYGNVQTPDGDVPLTKEDALESIEICKKEIERLESLGRSDDVIGDMIIAARAILLMNRVYLRVNGDSDENGDELQTDLNLWLKDFEISWLKTDKPSQLWRIAEHVHKMTAFPTDR